MYRKSIRTVIGTGKLTLPVALCFTALLWTFTGLVSFDNWAGFLVVAITTLVLRVIVNNHALIRERSWFLSSAFCVVCGVFLFQHHVSLSMLCVLSYLLSLNFLFCAYQETHPERYIFHSFIFLGFSIVLFPKLLVLILFYFIVMIVQLRAFTLRTLFASGMGLFVVAEIYVVYLFIAGKPFEIDAPSFMISLDFFKNYLAHWNPVQLINIGAVAFFFIVGTIHYSVTNFNDKIRTRMLFYAIITQGFLFLVMLALFPADYDFLSRLLILISAPVVAHYFVLGRGWIVDFFFGLFLLVLAALTVFNLWIPSFLSF